MGCYVVPVAAAIIHHILRRKVKPWRHDRHHRWLNLLFGGAAIFGFVDHLWNGELLAFSAVDLMLGLMITVTLVVFWAGIAWLDSRTASHSAEKART
ncbi:hypothetical protein ACFL3V_00175 [Nanoarchaeota archaeon]